MEIWVKILSGRYAISNKGRVKSFCRPNVKLLKTKLTKFGYRSVSLTFKKSGPTRIFFVHRLVAIEFISNRPRNCFVNHKDSNKQNNIHKNLEWVTRKENAEHAVVNGRYLRGEKHYRSKLTIKQVRNMTRMYLKGGVTYKQLGEKFGVTKATAYKAVVGFTYA